MSRDGTTAFVTKRAGSLVKVALATPNRSAAAGIIAPQQMVLFEDANLAWVIEFNTLGRLIQIDLANGHRTVLALGLQHAVGLAGLADRSAAFVTEQAETGGRITKLDLHTSTRTILADGFTLRPDTLMHTAQIRSPNNLQTERAIRCTGRRNVSTSRRAVQHLHQMCRGAQFRQI